MALLFAIIMFFNTLPYFNFQPRQGFLNTKPFSTSQNLWFRCGFYLHIGSSLLVWISGIFQLFPQLLFSNSKIHKWSGKIYIFLILFFASPGGLILAQYANGGLSAKIGFTLQSLVWWFVTFRAYRFIKQGKIKEHLHWMLQSLSVTYAAFSLRTESYLMINFFGTKPVETYLSVVWLSWVGNLLLMQVLMWFGIEAFYLNFLKNTRNE